MTTPRILGDLILLRHGHSEYTDNFPDLTKQGIKTVTKSAREIGRLIAQQFSISVISSPTIRAQGTAEIVQREIGHKGNIEIATAIRTADVRDQEYGQKVFKHYFAKGGFKALAIAYSKDQIYENPRVFEPRSSIQNRFFEFFSTLIRRMLIGSIRCAIVVSHYETLYNLVEEPFELDYEKDEPLKPGEFIAISIFDIGLQNIVEIAITFRGKTVKRNFDYSLCEMIQ